MSAPDSAQTLEPSLRSVLEQDLPVSEYETLVVIDTADDAWCAPIVGRLRVTNPEHDIRVLAASCASTTSAAARNVGLDHARGEHIIFVDAGDRVSDDLLSCLLQCADGMSVPVVPVVHLLSDGTSQPKPTNPGSPGEAGSPGDAGDERIDIDASAQLAEDCIGKLYPRSWVGDVRFDEDLTAGHETVFNARVFHPFARRFAQYCRTSMHSDAHYVRWCSADRAAEHGASPDIAARQRLDILRALTSAPEVDPADRTPLTRLLIEGHVGALLRAGDAHPDLQERISSALADLQIRADRPADEADWPGYEVLMSSLSAARPSRQPRHVTLLAGESSAIQRRTKQISYLEDADIDLRAAFLLGPRGRDFPAIPWTRLTIRHERQRPPTTRRRSRPRRAVHTALRRADRVGRRAFRRAAVLALPAPTVARLVDSSDDKARDFIDGSTVVALDETGGRLARSLGLVPQPAAWLDAQILAAAATANEMSLASARLVVQAAQRLATLPDGAAHIPPPPVWTLASLRLLRSTRRAPARRLLDAAQELYPDAAATHGWDVIRLHIGILEGSRLPSDDDHVCRAAMDEADRLMHLGARDHSLVLTHLVLETLFHPEVQANVADPPLVRNPETLLAPLSESRIWRDITTPINEASRPITPIVDARRRRPSVLVLPGAYPKFASVVEDALVGHADTEVLRLTGFAAHYGSTGPSLATLAQRHAASVGDALDVDSSIVEAFIGRDVVFADWADKGAMLASLLTPPGTRLIVRFHGVDSLSMWQFLIDWSRVTDVAFVSEHLRRTVVSHLGDRLVGVRQHVTGNVVDVARFTGPSTELAPRTLGLVGWGQQVKDPLWALEVLAELRTDDPRWRLTLIGTDFPRRPGRLSERRYAEAFRDRARQPDVRSAITYVGFSRNLPTHLADIGFALSTSLRESWHIGLMEMTAAHAVPVVRDWPVYQDHGGAQTLVPDDWIVRTPAEAAARIRAHADVSRWRAAADAAREHVSEHFGAVSTAATYRRLILGD